MKSIITNNFIPHQPILLSPGYQQKGFINVLAREISIGILVTRKSVLTREISIKILVLLVKLENLWSSLVAYVRLDKG